MGVAGALGAFGPAAGVALAPATGGMSLLASPLMQVLMQQGGIQLAGGLLERLFGGGQTPFEQSAAQGLAARSGLIGQLQQQAAGMPTAATRAQSRQLSQEVNRLQQSYGASASRQGIAGTTPARAQQGRLQAAKVQGLGNIMGASQISAQQQLGQLVGGAPEQQLIAETRKRASKKAFLGYVGGIFSEAGLLKDAGLLSAETEETLAAYRKLISSFTEAMQKPILPQ